MKFQFFRGELEENGSLSKELLKRLRKFTANTKVDAKSIGIEFLEADDEVVISIGYHEKTNNSKFDFKLKQIGELSQIGTGLVEFEAEHVCSKLKNVICHEIFVDGNDNINMIFMCKK
jgi:hypothetical protein